MHKKIIRSLFLFVTILSFSLNIQAPNKPKRFTTEEQAINFAIMIHKYYGIQPAKKQKLGRKKALPLQNDVQTHESTLKPLSLLPDHATALLALGQHVSPRKMRVHRQ